MVFSTRVVATALVAATSAAVSAQLSFEVASLRPSSSLHQGGTMGPKPGRFFATNVPTTAFLTFGTTSRVTNSSERPTGRARIGLPP